MPTAREVQQRARSARDNLEAFMMALPLIGWVYSFFFMIKVFGAIYVYGSNRLKESFIAILFICIYWALPAVVWFMFGKHGHGPALVVAFIAEFFICRYFYRHFIRIIARGIASARDS